MQSFYWEHLGRSKNIFNNWNEQSKSLFGLKSNKTNVMPFSINSINRPNLNEIKINFFNAPVKVVTHTKYLRVNIYQNLKWDEHRQYMCKKIKFIIYKFYLLREVLNHKLFLTFYKTSVESSLSYGILVWGRAYNSNLVSLKTVQNYVVKVIKKN